jgi:hypothetical protein
VTGSPASGGIGSFNAGGGTKLSPSEVDFLAREGVKRFLDESRHEGKLKGARNVNEVNQTKGSTEGIPWLVAASALLDVARGQPVSPSSHPEFLRVVMVVAKHRWLGPGVSPHKMLD